MNKLFEAPTFGRGASLPILGSKILIFSHLGFAGSLANCLSLHDQEVLFLSGMFLVIVKMYYGGDALPRN